MPLVPRPGDDAGLVPRGRCCGRPRACSGCTRWSPSLYHALPEAKRVGAVAWPGKAAVTFSDALTAVRRWLWAEGVFPQAGADTALEKLPRHVQELLLTALTPAP